MPGDPFTLCIIDEAHRALAQSYRTALDRIAPKYLLGLTATPNRTDQQCLSTLFEARAYTKTLLDLIEMEYLANVLVETLPIGIDLSAVRIKQGDFRDTDVAVALDPMLEELADLIATRYRDKKLLTFCPLCKTSALWTEALRRRGLPAAHVDGDSKDQDKILEAFKNNEIRFLSNADLLVEGYDEPSIDAVLPLRPTKSIVLFSQMIGRGTRLFPGKSHVAVLDPLFLSERHNLISVADITSETPEDAGRLKDLMRLEKLDLKQAAARVKADREASLAGHLAENAWRKGYQKELGELAETLGAAGLDRWSPTQSWQKDRPTEEQLRVVEKAGIDRAIIWCKGLASEVISRIVSRREDNLATYKQIRLLRDLGHPQPETVSFEAAKAWIDESRRQAR